MTATAQQPVSVVTQSLPVSIVQGLLAPATNFRIILYGVNITSGNPILTYGDEAATSGISRAMVNVNNLIYGLTPAGNNQDYLILSALIGGNVTIDRILFEKAV